MGYCYSTDEETFYGDFATILDAATEAFSENEDLNSVWVGESVPKTIAEYFNDRDTENLLEVLVEAAFDDVGGAAEGWLDPPRNPRWMSKDTPREIREMMQQAYTHYKNEVLPDLTEGIQKALTQWAEAKRVQPTFFGVKDVQLIYKEVRP